MSFCMSIDAASRRRFLERSGLGFGGLALSYLLNAAPTTNPLAAKAPPLPATAKNVIFLFMHGGPSQIDTFDPEPLLAKLGGQPVPGSFGTVQLQFSKIKERPVQASWRTL